MNDMVNKNILIVGVGGQGIVLVSEIIAKVCMTYGYDVKQNEVHGMAQRGGSVVSHVRYGNKIHSPLIEIGQADVLLSFELLEAQRWLYYLKKDGIAIINTQQIEPMSVLSGKTTYPENIESQIKDSGCNVKFVNGTQIAKDVNNLRSVNISLIGALSNELEFDENLWTDAIKGRVPQKTIESNLKAFEFGRQAK